MRGVRRFQDLDAHKLAVQLRREIFRLTKRAPAAKDFKFASLDETKDQIDDGRDSEYFTDEESDRLLSLAAISRLMEYLESPQAQRAYESIRKARRRRPFRSKN